MDPFYDDQSLHQFDAAMNQEIVLSIQHPVVIILGIAMALKLASICSGGINKDIQCELDVVAESILKEINNQFPSLHPVTSGGPTVFFWHTLSDEEKNVVLHQIKNEEVESSN